MDIDQSDNVVGFYYDITDSSSHIRPGLMNSNSVFKLPLNTFSILYISSALYHSGNQEVWYKLRYIKPSGTTGNDTYDYVCENSVPGVLVGQDLVKAVVTVKHMFISYFKFYRFVLTGPAVYTDFGVYTEPGDARFNLGNDYANYPAPYGSTSDVWSKLPYILI